MYPPFDFVDWESKRRVRKDTACLRYLGCHECDNGHYDPLPPHQVRRATADEAGAQSPSFVRQHVPCPLENANLAQYRFRSGWNVSARFSITSILTI